MAEVGGPPIIDGSQVLAEYIALKCEENLTLADFPSKEDDGGGLLDTLHKLPLFQAIQVVHRFNDSVGPRVVNRQAFLVSIIRATNRWWAPRQEEEEEDDPQDGKEGVEKKKEGDCKSSVDGPNTRLLVRMCMQSALSPDVFTPGVCHMLQMLSPLQIAQIAHDFNSHALAQAFSNDSYYAKQQLFLSMAQACIREQRRQGNNTSTTPPTPPPAAVVRAVYRPYQLPPSPSSSSIHSASPSSSDADTLPGQQQQQQVHGILTEFIARTCAASRGRLAESDVDAAARDALRRLYLLQALQAVQHFAVSIAAAATPHMIKNRSAFLMGIIHAQEQHWSKSRAAQLDPEGAHGLLNLSLRLVLKIAHLCLDGHCLPSDFSPEVCLELRRCANCDQALLAVLSFNNNKRISAGAKGGIRDRAGFLQRLVRNVIQQQHLQQQQPEEEEVVPPPPMSPSPPLPLPPPARRVVVGGGGQLELNPKAKPYSPLQRPMMLLSSSSPSSSALPPLPVPPPLSSCATPTASSSSSRLMMDDARLLESSREAIDYLTSCFARSRTSEIRLRRELAESQAQIHSLLAQMQRLREENLRNIENARAQILVNVSRNFDSLLRGASEQQQQHRQAAGATSSPLSPALTSATGFAAAGKPPPPPPQPDL